MDICFYIVGVKHCGKSTVGKELSQELNVPFFDLDDLIEKKLDTTVRDFFKQNGKVAFQKVETEVLKELQQTESSFICATGGGISDNNKALKLLENKSIIYINTPFSIVYSRIIKSGIPAFLKSDDPETEFSKIFTNRNIIYSTIANYIINGNDKSPKELVDEILKKIKGADNAR